MTGDTSESLVTRERTDERGCSLESRVCHCGVRELTVLFVNPFGCKGTEGAVVGAETDGTQTRPMLRYTYRNETEIGCFGQVMRREGWQTGSREANGRSWEVL